MNGASQANDLLHQIDDIHGLGKIDWWPLAPGWWALIALTVVMIAAITTFYLRRRAWRRSWKNDAANLLSTLEKNLGATNAQKTAAVLSVTLRRIAMRRFSRKECAGLQGSQWLQWLGANDPQGFDWPHMGLLLIDAPYAPPGGVVSPEAIRPLIHAARNWVR